MTIYSYNRLLVSNDRISERLETKSALLLKIRKGYFRTHSEERGLRIYDTRYILKSRGGQRKIEH